VNYEFYSMFSAVYFIHIYAFVAFMQSDAHSCNDFFLMKN